MTCRGRRGETCHLLKRDFVPSLVSSHPDSASTLYFMTFPAFALNLSPFFSETPGILAVPTDAFF